MTAQSRPQSASENDRLWFETHPDRSFRLRLPMVGESTELSDTREGMILVRQFKAGARARLPVPFLILMPPSVVGGRVLTEPEAIRPPASEIFGATEKECREVWLHRVKPETRANLEQKF